MNAQVANNLLYKNREATIIPFPYKKNRSVDRQEKARSQGFPKDACRALSLPDQARRSYFVMQLIELIEANLDDESYRIEQICRDMGASRSKIHRIIKRWTGHSTSKFIQLIRLRTAAKLLLTSDLNVAQVAYEVGFKDAPYFSRVFTMNLGVCPRAFRKSEQGL